MLFLTWHPKRVKVFLRKWNGMWQVYILKCKDNTYYVGCTQDLIERLKRHNNGDVRFTQARLPVEIVTTINFTNKYQAFNFEKYLKSGSGRAFMNKRLI